MTKENVLSILKGLHCALTYSDVVKDEDFSTYMDGVKGVYDQLRRAHNDDWEWDAICILGEVTRSENLQVICYLLEFVILKLK